MSSIDKMAIQGIRSFDNHQNETIQFFSPLTLIVGHNGSGKTTVIECLRYATTGQMPPNTKGGAFIHDPDVCGEKEVYSQVKLSFNNTNGERMICTRSLSLVVKKTARSMKTLDGTLTIVRNGERSTISTRCADLDLQMPLSLGVSAAVLDFVIFCHQEDSTWPLSEAGVLKKRFDLIFEALKYTKALDQIKAVRKEQIVTVKVESARLELYKVNKERAAKKQAESEQLVDNIESFRARVSSLDKQISEALVEQNLLFQSGAEFEGIIADLGKYRHERKIMEESYKDLSRNIVEYEEGDAELRDMQANFASNMAKQERVVELLRQQVREIKHTMTASREEMNESLSHEGQLRAEAERYEKQLSQRNDLIKTISRQQNIRGYDMTLDETQVNEFEDKLKQMVKSQSAKLERVKREGREQENVLNNELSFLLTRHTERESSKTSARIQIQNIERKLGELQNQLQNNSIDEGEIVLLENNLKEAEEKLIESRNSLDKADYESLLRSKNSELRAIDDKIDTINQEINLGNRQSDTRAKLGLLQSEHRRKDDAVKSLISTSKGPFLTVTGKDLNIRSMDTDLRLTSNSTEAEVEDAEKADDIAGKDVSQLEAQINVQKEQLKKKRKEENTLKATISEVFDDIDTADDEISRIEKDLEKAQGNYYQAQYAVKFYERALTFAEQRSRCQLCDQGFHDDFTLEDFMQLIDAKKSMVPRHLANAQEAIDGFTTDLNNAKSVLPARASLKSIQSEIPLLQTQLDLLQENLKRAVGASETTTSRLRDLRSRFQVITGLERACTEINKTQREANEIKRQISSLESELEATGSSRSIDDMQGELARLQEDSRRVKREISQAMNDRDVAKATLNVLDGKRRDIQLIQAEAYGRLREKQNVQSRIDECKEAVEKNNEIIRDTEQKCMLDEPEIARLRTEFQALKTANETAENNIQREASRLLASQNNLISADAEINSYLQRGGPDDLARSLRSTEELRKTIENAEKRLVELEEEINIAEKRNNDLKSTERNINDNLRLRKVKYDIQRLGKTIEELESQNAERDRDQYILDSKRLKDHYSKLMTERAGLMGEMTQLDRTLQQCLKELETEFKDADEVYRKKLIEVRTTEKANEDLDKYGRALDNAIMKYHSLKMEEINKIVDELWKATYCGTDVDSISIRSEGESAASNRSYNYRVCMIKGDAELDMRGRCSAGQKVLAAIIIRLALAECFGVNCGILALDEPTTNLDRENIESLAKSLGNIIANRRSQKNFQLIVITHDEEFLRMMGCSDYCDYYYRVSRNEHQKSIIERQRVSTVL